MDFVNLLPFLRALQKSTSDSSGMQPDSGDDAEAPTPYAASAQPGMQNGFLQDPSQAASYGQAQQQALPSQTPANQQVSATPQTEPFPQVETPSAEDIANGNYIVVGFRHLLRDDPAELAFHTYVRIPQMENGKANGTLDSYGVLGNPNSPNGENQQVRKNDRDPRWPDKQGNPQDRNSQVPGFEGKEVRVKVTPDQREALRQGMDNFAQTDNTGNFTHPCPVCGDNYHLLGTNSNELIYNMLFWNPAGPIPAPHPVSAWRTPSYYRNDPNKPWYQNQVSSSDQE